MASYKYHPACLLFPTLPEDEITSLAEDIRQNGLLHPIVTFEGKILDGRNRLKACKIAGVKPRFVEWAGEGSPVAWAIATNLVRRHLTPSQRAVVGLELLPLLEAEAKERQRRSAGRGKKGAKELATFSGKASQLAAKITRSNSAYVEKVKSINRLAPDLIPALKEGRMNVSEAVKLSKLTASQREQVLENAEKNPQAPVRKLTRSLLIKEQRKPGSTKSAPSEIEIWCGDCVKLMQQKISDGEVSVVVTSPPFNRGVKYSTYDDHRPDGEYYEWLDSVFFEIHRVLHEDGSLFLNVGHSPQKPWAAMKMAELAGKYLHLQNQIIWLKAIAIDGISKGHFSPVQGHRFLNRNWEYIFHFTKTGNATIDRLGVGVPYEYPVNAARTGNTVRCGGDVWFVPHETVRGAEDRADHPATFPPELTERCIRLAGIKPGMLFLDPFCGVNGMLGARSLGIRGIGIDVDPNYCEAARERLVQ